MPYTVTHSNSFIFLALLILAFFPSLWHSVLTLPLLPFYWFFSSPTPSAPPVPTTSCCCCAFSASPTVTTAVAVATETTAQMSWVQKIFTLPPKSRGSYLIDDEVVKNVPEIKQFKTGVLHLFVQHTSCGLSLNENWDRDVREDMSDALDRLAPEDHKGTLYRHSAEGLDDMPAHIKSALVGASVSVPITNGKMNTGTWQGIWYLEFRESRHSRKVVATLQGERM